MQITQTLRIQHFSPIIIKRNSILQQLKLNKLKFKNKEIDSHTYCSELLRLLKMMNVLSSKKFLSVKEPPPPRVYKSYINLSNDKKTSLSRYYAGFINDSLSLIRHKKVAYVFTEEHIKDILKFEPNISVTHKDNCFCVSL